MKKSVKRLLPRWLFSMANVPSGGHFRIIGITAAWTSGVQWWMYSLDVWNLITFELSERGFEWGTASIKISIKRSSFNVGRPSALRKWLYKRSLKKRYK